MKLLSFRRADEAPTGAARPGLLTSDGAGVIDLGDRLAGITSVDDLVRLGRVEEARAHQGQPADRLLTDIIHERVFTWPRKVFCIGVNYGGRAAEYEDTSDATWPSVFVRFPDSFTGHDQPLRRPPESPQLDYEGEIVAVIGKGGRRIPRADALDHVAGFALGNEGTIRDWVRHAKFNVTQGKNWERSGAIGPWFVPRADAGVASVADFEALELTTHVNGELRQRDTPATMKYPLDYQIHYLSTFTELAPGDIIFTGTPTGAGARMDPPVWLEPGDVVEVSVPALGTLRNTIADEFDDGRTIDPPEAQ